MKGRHRILYRKYTMAPTNLSLSLYIYICIQDFCFLWLGLTRNVEQSSYAGILRPANLACVLTNLAPTELLILGTRNHRHPARPYTCSEAVEHSHTFQGFRTYPRGSKKPEFEISGPIKH